MTGNTVGSLELSRIVRVRKNLFLEMSHFQKEVLVGCILGDAYITKLGKIKIEQGAKNKEYVFWQYSVLSSLAYPALPRKMERFNKKYDKYYYSFRFSLRQYFRSWRFVFYPQGRKIFPKDLCLTPAILAVWYMDDGCWTGKKVVISIEGFDDTSQENIQKALEQQMNIFAKIGKNRKLVVRKKSHSTFFETIVPYIVPSMTYKVPKPRND